MLGSGGVVIRIKNEMKLKWWVLYGALFISFGLLPMDGFGGDFSSADIDNTHSWASESSRIVFAENLETTNSSNRSQHSILSLGSLTNNRTNAMIAGTVAAVGIYGAFTWWRQGVSDNFRTIDEGWFGQDTYAGGADKLGHAFSAYVGTRLLKKGFEWAGNDADKSLWLAAGTTFGTLLAVEVVDGFSKEFSFSKEDFLMNTIGVGLGVLFEKQPALDNLFDFRVHYWPSSEAKRLNRYNPIADYSGQTYLFLTKASGIPALRKLDGVKYLEFAVGYGSRGYEPNDGSPVERSRHTYIGVSINLSEVLSDTVFRQSKNGRAHIFSNMLLEYVQVPGTVWLNDHRL